MRDDLINPVKMSVRPSTITLNAATNQIFVKVIRGQGQGHVRLKVSKMTIFQIYLLCHFSTNQKNSNNFWY